MSLKKANAGGPDTAPVRVIVETPEAVARNRQARVEVVSLSIDEDFDPGSDPYNRTGQFVALELRDEEG